MKNLTGLERTIRFQKALRLPTVLPHQYGRQTAKGGPAGASKSPGSGPPPRQRKYLPILFDFEKPKSRNTDETITLLARVARFVVADKGGVPGGMGAGALTYGALGRGPVSVCFRQKKQTRNAQVEPFC
jgi:hypothetical protein